MVAVPVANQHQPDPTRAPGNMYIPGHHRSIISFVDAKACCRLPVRSTRSVSVNTFLFLFLLWPILVKAVRCHENGGPIPDQYGFHEAGKKRVSSSGHKLCPFVFGGCERITIWRLHAFNFNNPAPTPSRCGALCSSRAACSQRNTVARDSLNDDTGFIQSSDNIVWII